MGQAALQSTHRHSRRTILSASPELQILMRLISAIGAENAHAAEVLVMTNYSFESAARMLLVWRCQECPFEASIRNAEEIRGIDAAEPRCPKCWSALEERSIEPARLRQRVHRMQAKVRALLGPLFDVSKRTRAVVSFGAEDKGVYRMSAASASGEGDEE